MLRLLCTTSSTKITLQVWSFEQLFRGKTSCECENMWLYGFKSVYCISVCFCVCVCVYLCVCICMYLCLCVLLQVYNVQLLFMRRQRRGNCRSIMRSRGLRCLWTLCTTEGCNYIVCSWVFGFLWALCTTDGYNYIMWSPALTSRSNKARAKRGRSIGAFVFMFVIVFVLVYERKCVYDDVLRGSSKGQLGQGREGRSVGCVLVFLYFYIGLCNFLFNSGFGDGNVQVCVFVCDDMIVVAIKEQQGQGREGSLSWYICVCAFVCVCAYVRQCMMWLFVMLWSWSLSRSNKARAGRGHSIDISYMHVFVYLPIFVLCCGCLWWCWHGRYQGATRPGPGGVGHRWNNKAATEENNLVQSTSCENRPFDYPWVASVVNTFGISSHRWFSLLVENCNVAFFLVS